MQTTCLHLKRVGIKSQRFWINGITAVGIMSFYTFGVPEIQSIFFYDIYVCDLRLITTNIPNLYVYVYMYRGQYFFPTDGSQSITDYRKYAVRFHISCYYVYIAPSLTSLIK